MKCIGVILCYIVLLSAQEFNFKHLLRLSYATDRSFEGSEMTIPFYPIGWSEDGTRFAYFVEPCTEGGADYSFHLIIQNMVTDSILFHYESSDSTTFYDSQKYNSLLAPHLTSNGIYQQMVDLTLNSWAEANDFSGLRYDVKIAIDSLPRNEYNDIPGVKIMVEKIRAGYGRKKGHLKTKTIYSQSYYNSQTKRHLYTGLQEYNILGTIWNNQRERFLVVVIERYRGWEGPPSIQRVRLVGCSVKGF